MSPWQAVMDDDRNGVAHEILARLGDRWSVAVILMIEGEPVRFTDLQRRISATSPISARVLTRTLKQLERDGLIARKVFPVMPPKVEYRLTGLGRRFLGLADRIAEWTTAHGPAIAAARRITGAGAPQPFPSAA